MNSLLAGAALVVAAVPALAQDMTDHQHHHQPQPVPAEAAADDASMRHGATAAPPIPATPPGHAGVDHGPAAAAHPAEHMATMDGMAAGHGASSGTARVPAEDRMRGLHVMSGEWLLMAHGYVWPAYTRQGGQRGDAMGFVQSMAMVDASRPLGGDLRLRLRSMMSLEPLMGDRGYPNLFTTGETAAGLPLVDRQHPHDLFMELSARLDWRLGPGNAFVYGGLPGEPALGPSAFMHRGSARFLAQGPITHHWFDSTHITFGVVTAGYGTPLWQVEGSTFNSREPGENRWNIETGRLDSWSVRASLTPVPRWAAQISYGELKEPERIHPGENEHRLTASLSYSDGRLDMTAGFARKDRRPGPALTAWLAEATWLAGTRHAVFGRIENVANDELFENDHASPLHDRTFRVTRLVAGYAYLLPLGPAVLALGGEAATSAKPRVLEAAYGRRPVSFTLSAKLMLGR